MSIYQGFAKIPVYDDEADAEANIPADGNIPQGVAYYDDGTGSIKVADGAGAWDAGTGAPVASNVADAAAATAATLTDSSGGTANTTIAVITAAAAITDNSGGVDPGDDTIAAISALTDYTPHASGATTVTSNAATDLDTTAAALETFRDEQVTVNTELSAAVAQLAAKMNTTSTAIGAATDGVADLAAQVNALIADVADIRTQFNATLSSLETAGLMASS